MGDPRVTASSSVKTARPPTLDAQMLDILNNPRMSEKAKVAELEKAVANLSEPEKKALYERLKDRKSQDPVSRQLHYRLSHHPDKAGQLSTVDQVLTALKPSPAKVSAPPAQDVKTANAGKGPSPAPIDQKTSDAVARYHFSKQASATDKKAAAAPSTDATGLRPGESISAKSKQSRDGVTFDFSRPVTKEQAAAIIFQKGKVPPEAELVQGKGNVWIVKIPNDMDAIQNVVKHYNSHTETLVTKQRISNEWSPPETDVTFTWVGGEPKTSSAGPKRRDLKNDMGFVISKKYPLDEGQSPATNLRTLVTKGPGYEVVFEKPMTKDQVMDKLFEKNTDGVRQVRLVPVPMEPTSVWQVQILDGVGTNFKRGVDNAFQDANVYAKESIAPTVPAGIRAHIENHNVPKDAKQFPPDVYVWEQEGHIVRVETNGKQGKDGYYTYETTQLHPTDEQGNNTMRYFMLEKGLPVRKAWQEYIKHWDEIHIGLLGMVAGAARMPHMPGPMPRVGSSPRPRVRVSGGEPMEVNVPKPSRTIVESPPPPPPRPPVKSGGPAGPGGPGSDTIVAHPPPMPRVKTAKGPAANANVPEPPPQKPAGRGTAADSQPPLPPPPPGKGKTLPGSLYRRVGRPSNEPPPVISWFPKKSGTKLTAEQVTEINRIDSGRIGWSMTEAEHMRQWKVANPGSKEPPPIAFTTPDGRVVVNEERWIKSGQPALWGLEP